MVTGFQFEELDLRGAYRITSFYSGDTRGSFTKVFEKSIYENAGIEFNLSETFLSVSGQNVIRGIHFQIHNPQAKLVSVPRGRVFDVIVDLRMSSPTYREWRGFYLGEDNHHALFIPKGFGHGFLSLEENTCMLYQCDGPYDAKTDTGIVYDDKDLAIQWPTDNLDMCLHSDRDLGLMTLKEYEKNPMQI